MSQYQKLKGTSEPTFSIGLDADQVSLVPDIANSHIDVTCVNGPMTVGAPHVVSWGDIQGTISNQTDLQAELDGKSDIDHNHDGVYSPIDHNHAGVYEPANANIQSHIAQITGNPHHVTAAEAGAAPAVHSHDYVWDITAGLNITIDKTDPRNPIISSSGGSGVWGSITGTLSDQTDLQTALDGKAPTVHTHLESDITNLDKYTQAEVDSLLAGKSDTSHNHAGVYEPANANIQAHIGTVSGNPHNVLFSELSDTPASYPPSAHTHVEADITNLDKYTQAEVDALFAAHVPNAHTHVEADVTNLDKYTQAEVDQAFVDHTAINAHGKMNWRGVWTQALYEQHDVVKDGEWTMIANKQTSDPASPQPIGSPIYDMPDIPTWNDPIAEHTGVVWSGHRYTVEKGGWIERIEVWPPELTTDTNYRVILADVTDPQNIKSSTINNPVLVEDAWAVVSVGSLVVTPGTVLELWLDVLNSGSDTLVTGGWNRAANNQIVTTDPGLAAWGTDNSNTSLRINKTDLDSNDRSTELLSMGVGTVIEIVDTLDAQKSMAWTVNGSPVDQGTHVSWAALTFDGVGPSGAPDVLEPCTITARVPVPASTRYEQADDFWLTGKPSWATAVGILRFDGVDQAGVENAGFGVRFSFQEASVSPDWDLVATSSSGASGGGGGGEGIPDAPSDGTMYARINAIWSNIAISNVTGLQTALDGKAPTVHTHVEADITNLDKYTQAEVDALLAGKSDTSHAHDERYVRGDNVVGANIVNTTGVDFIFSDTNLSPNYYIWRDVSANLLYLGSPNAQITPRSNIVPNIDVAYDIGGAALQFLNTYSQKFYQNGVEISTIYAPIVHNHDGVYLPIDGKAADSALLDGYNANVNDSPDTIALRDANADLSVRRVESTFVSDNPTVSRIMTKNGTDDYLRPATPAVVSAALGIMVWSSAQPADATAGDGYRVDTTVNAAINLPAAPADGDQIGFNDRLGGFETIPLTIGRSAKSIMGVAEDMTVSTNWTTVVLEFDAGDDNWWVVYKT